VRISFVLLTAVVLALTVFSCKEKGGKNINQGEIHYNITYKGYSGIIPKDFLPKTLIVSFNRDKILFEMTGIGNSGIINLSNPEKGIFDTYFSMVSAKYYYAAKADEVFPGFEKMEGMVIKKTSKTSLICGYNCKNAEITFPDHPEIIFEIWYTNEIKVKNANASTPFKQIDGVLMSFFFMMGTTELHFDAEAVYEKVLPDFTFERRQKYTRVSKEDIKTVMGNMVNL
jgi:hypothetical protein